MPIGPRLRHELLHYQRNEITEHHFYKRLAASVRTPQNRAVLENISDQELRHYHIWRQYTETDVRPGRIRLWRYLILARLLGFTFAIKLMELSEAEAQARYKLLYDSIPEAASIVEDEINHETELIELLDERHLRYISSIILGLNDALIELTGALAGLTLALRDTQLVALTGLITGIAAAMSMSASVYLAERSGETGKQPLRASFYTGSTYLFTVFLLILPFLLINAYLTALAVSLVTAIIIIAVFNYYISIAKGVAFRARFLEMAGLSMGVALLGFLVGIGVRILLGIET